MNRGPSSKRAIHGTGFHIDRNGENTSILDIAVSSDPPLIKIKA
jgi:hypothetical protein